MVFVGEQELWKDSMLALAKAGGKVCSVGCVCEVCCVYDQLKYSDKQSNDECLYKRIKQCLKGVSDQTVVRLVNRIESGFRDVLDYERRIDNRLVETVKRVNLSGVNYVDYSAVDVREKLMNNVIDRCKSVGLDTLCVDIMNERNKVVDLVTPGYKKYEKKEIPYVSKNFGVESVSKMYVVGKAVDKYNDLKDVASKRIDMNEVIIVKSKHSKYLRDVGVIRDVCIIDKCYKREVNERVVDLCDFGLQVNLEDVHEIVDDNISVSNMSSNCSDCVSVTETECSNVSKISRVSKFSLKSLFGKRSRVLDNMCTDELYNQIMRSGVSENCVDNDVWVNFPCKCHVACVFLERMLEKGKERYVVGDGFKHYMKLNKSVIKIEDIDSKLTAKVFGDWQGYCLMNENIQLMVVLCKFKNVYDNMSSFFSWCSNDFSRMVVEFPASVDVLRIVEMVRECGLKLRVVDQRNVDYSVVTHMVKSEVKIFPKLNNSDLGFCRSPEYLVGTAYDVSFVNAMIEFKHTISLVDAVNATEYDKVLVNLDDELSVSVEMLGSLAKAGYNLYDNVLKRGLVNEMDIRVYMYGYVRKRFVLFNKVKKNI